MQLAVNQSTERSPGVRVPLFPQMTILSEIHHEFFSHDRPVEPKHRRIIIPLDKWTDNTSTLQKSFRFRRANDRNDFVIELFEYEKQVRHSAKNLY